jgi:hypothetical protein
VGLAPPISFATHDGVNIYDARCKRNPSLVVG